MATAYNIAFELGARLTSDFRSAFGDANKEMSNLLKASQKMTSIGKGLTVGVTTPLVGMGAMATKTFASFDDSMRNVQAVSGATGSEFEQLTKLAKDLGAQTAWSASQSADAMGYLALAGWDTNQIISATPGLLDLASAASMDLAGAADIVSDVMSAFGMSAEEAGNAADMFAQTSRKSNTDVNQLGEALKYAGSASSAAGMDLSQTNAILGVLADSGIKGSMAGTTVVSMLRDLRKNSKDGAIAVGEASIALYDQAGNMRDLGTVMADVEKATQGMNTQQKDAALGAVFGTEAMKGANVMLAAGSERYRELEDAIRNSDGVAKEMADNLEGGIGGAFRSLASAVESLAISFGETLAPYMIAAANYLADFARVVSSLPDGVRLVIVVFSALLASIGPVLLITGLMIEKTISVIVAYRAARVAISSLNIMTRIYNATQVVSTFLMNAQRAAMYGYIFAGGGVRGVIVGISSALRAMNLAFLANPYVLVAAGLALVAFAFYKAWTNSETFRNVVLKIVEVTKAAFMGLATFVMSHGGAMWNGLVSGLGGVGERVIAGLKRTMAFGRIMRSYVEQQAITMWMGLVQGIESIGNIVAEAAGPVVSRFMESFKTGLSSLPGIMSLIAPTLAGIGLSFLGISGPIGLVITAVISLIGFIYRLSQTNEGVASAISSAWQAVLTAFAPIIDVFKQAADQFSAEVGPEFEKTMEVISQSMEDLAPVFAELGETVAQLAPLIGELFGTYLSMVAQNFTMIATTVLPLFAQAFQMVIPAIASIIQTVLPVVIELIASIIPVLLNIATTLLPMFLNVFVMVFTLAFSIVQAVLPLIIDLLATIIPIIMEIIEMVLPMLLGIFMTVFPIILEVVQAVLPIFISLLTLIVTVVMTLAEVALPMILSVIQMVFPVVLGIIQAIIPIIAAILQILVAVITGVVIPAINAILSVVQVVFPFIEMIISSALAIITGILQAAMALIQGDWSGAWNAIQGIATTIMDNIISFFSSIDLFSVGKSIIDGLINGIKSMAGSVVGAITNLIPAPLRGAVSSFIGAIPGFAKGGVVNETTLAWVGEGGDTESIIPWNNTQRSKDLWLQTGQAIGMLDSGTVGESANDVLEAQSTPTSIDSYGVSDNYETTNNSNRDYIIQIEHKGNVFHVESGDADEVSRKVEESDAELAERIKRVIENERRKDL